MEKTQHKLIIEFYKDGFKVSGTAKQVRALIRGTQ